MQYYQNLYDKYKRKAKRGRGFAISGIVTALGGYGLMYAGVANDNQFLAGAGLVTFGYSLFAFNIGIPSWAANAAKAKANANVVNEMKKQNKYMPKEIVFGGTSNGVGVTLKL